MIKVAKRLNQNNTDTKLVWAFFILLLVDGILRKWLLPSLATPIMFLKQVLAIYLVTRGYYKGYINGIWSTFSIILGFSAFLTTILFGHQNLPVAVWGGINWWFGIPLCMYIRKVLSKDETLRMLRIIVYTSIINSVVTCLQYFSPISSFINRQIGDEVVEISSQDISTLGGMFRCSGIFGYITQSSNFSPVALGATLYFFFLGNKLEKYTVNRIIIIVSLGLYLAMCVFSVSRSTIFFSIFSLIFIITTLALIGKGLKNFLQYLITLFLVSIVAFSVPSVQKSVDTISKRFTNAAGSTDQKNAVAGNLQDVINRGIFYTLDAILNPKTIDGQEIPFWGYGQGMSTQVGGRLLGSNKNSGFALAEWDSKRYVAESGLLLGLMMMVCRLGFVLSILPQVVVNARRGNLMPIFLYPAFFINFFFLTQWGNTYLFNLAIFCGGICLASMDKKVKLKQYTK